MGSDSWSTQTLMRHNRRDDRGRARPSVEPKASGGPPVAEAYLQLLRSGPRKMLHFDPSQSSAVIVTCGGRETQPPEKPKP